MIKIKTKINALLGVASFALLTACASVPPPINKTAAINASNIETTNSFKGISGSWPNEEWWLSYKDSQLNSLIYEALSNSPSLEIAQARIEQALALTEQVDASSDIQANLTALPYFQKQSYNGILPKNAAPKGLKDYGQITIDAKKDLDIWGQKRSQFAASVSLLDAAKADEANVKNAITSAITSEYVGLIDLYNNKAEMQKLLVIMQEYAKLTEMRVKNGLDLKSKLDLANANVNGIQIGLKTQDERIDIQKSKIAALVGHSPEVANRITEPKISPRNFYGLPQDLKADLISRRADIVAAKLRVLASEKSIDAKKTQYYPNISIGGNIGVSSLGLDKILDSGSLIGQFGPAISLPIFAKKNLDASLLSSEADYNLAVANYNQTVINAFNEVSQIAVSYRDLDDQIALADEYYNSNKAAFEVIRNRQKAGLATTLDLINAEATVLNAKILKIYLEDRKLPLEISLIKALGGGYNQTDNKIARQ